MHLHSIRMYGRIVSRPIFALKFMAEPRVLVFSPSLTTKEEMYVDNVYQTVNRCASTYVDVYGCQCEKQTNTFFHERVQEFS